MVKEVSAKAPVGSESFVNTFDYLMHVSLQNFDQAYSATKDVHAVFEKSIDGVMSSFQGQFAPDLKPAIQARKAITA